MHVDKKTWRTCLLVWFICIFRKHFENIVPFSEIILVLLQAYGFIISTSVCMFYIHACQCLLRGTRSSACKMGEQAVWAFTMDDRCHHDRTGDTICGADGFRIPCHAWWFRGGHQHSRLYALFFAYLHGNLQHRDHTFQPQKDDTDVQWHFILWLAVLAMPIAIFSTTLLYIVGPAVLLALLFFNLTFIALGSSYVPTEELLDKEEENKGSSRTRYMRSGGIVRFLPKKQDHFCRVWILLSHSSLPNLQDKRRLFSYRMESLPVYRCSTKRFKLSVSIFCKNSAKTFRIAKNEQFTRVSPQ